MKINVDLNKVATAILTAFVLFVASMIWDFQNLKGRVSATEKQLISLDDKIDVMAKLTCKRAIEDNLMDAKSICVDVLKPIRR